MLHRAIATLRDTLRPHLGLSKDRAETLSLVAFARVSTRTVNLSLLAVGLLQRQSAVDPGAQPVVVQELLDGGGRSPPAFQHQQLTAAQSE